MSSFSEDVRDLALRRMRRLRISEMDPMVRRRRMSVGRMVEIGIVEWGITMVGYVCNIYIYDKGCGSLKVVVAVIVCVVLQVIDWL